MADNSSNGLTQQSNIMDTQELEGYTVDNAIPSTSAGADLEDGAAGATTTVSHPESNIPVLHSLAQQGDLERIREILDNGDAKATDVDNEGITALHWAAMNSALEVCKLLLERGADVDAVGGELHATPLHWATRLVYFSFHYLRQC